MPCTQPSAKIKLSLAQLSLHRALGAGRAYASRRNERRTRVSEKFGRERERERSFDESGRLASSVMTQNICWWRGNFLIRRLTHSLTAGGCLPASADWPPSSDWPLRLAQISSSIIYYALSSAARWNLSRNQQIIFDGRSTLDPKDRTRSASLMLCLFLDFSRATFECPGHVSFSWFMLLSDSLPSRPFLLRSVQPDFLHLWFHWRICFIKRIIVSFKYWPRLWNKFKIILTLNIHLVSIKACTKKMEV